VYLLLSDRGWDAQFREAYLEEALSRQVSWFAKDHKHPELLILETDTVAIYRLTTTFSVFLIASILLLTHCPSLPAPSGHPLKYSYSDVPGKSSPLLAL
jgi:hypothetical protein